MARVSRALGSAQDDTMLSAHTPLELAHAACQSFDCAMARASRALGSAQDDTMLSAHTPLELAHSTRQSAQSVVPMRRIRRTSKPKPNVHATKPSATGPMFFSCMPPGLYCACCR